MVYRGVLTLHEGDLLVLSDIRDRSYTQSVHKRVIGKLTRIQPMVGVFAGAATATSLLLVSTYVYSALEVIRMRIH
jgi:hypothetical protein